MEENKSQSPHPKSTVVLIVITLVLAILLIAGAVWFFVLQSPKDDSAMTNTATNTATNAVSNTTNTTTTTTEANQSDNLKSYTGKDVKIAFKYPAVWGDVTEKTNFDTSGSNPLVKGGTFTISFSKNPHVNLYGGTKDVDTSGIGGACPIYNYFNGTFSGKALSCAGATELGEDGLQDCKDTKVGGQSAAQMLYVPIIQCADTGFQRVVYAQMSGTGSKDFAGVAVVLNVQDMNAKLSSSGIEAQLRTDEQAVKAAENEYNSTVSTVKNELVSGAVTNYLTAQQLSELNGFVGSITFTK